MSPATAFPGIARLDSTEADFESHLRVLLDRAQSLESGVEPQVTAVLADVRARGDAALLEYTAKWDGHTRTSVRELEFPPTRLMAALHGLPAPTRDALMTAAERIRRYHERQRIESWRYTEDDGTVLGQQVTALDRVGLYVPGGKAAYPSSVLMNAIPARVAGVPELIMVSPTPRGEVNEMVLAAAAIAGVNRVFAVGGAQAVAALAYGTETVPRVDKIVGPGNIHVATAKRMVFGRVDIDMIAGPSEIVVICDGKTDPAWVAMDLFSQAEHDEDAQAILITTDAGFLVRVQSEMARLIVDMPRAATIRASLAVRGAFIRVRDLDEAAAISNRIAPEHLELSVAEPESLALKIRHAGAIFLGRHTAEALGDYCAGPNHVLPTSGTARFSSPLGVYDFQKRTSLIGCSAAGAATLGRVAMILAEGEGLTAHARSAEFRCNLSRGCP